MSETKAEATAVKATARKATRKAESTAKAGFCVYLGPTIIGVIQHGAILHGTKQEALSFVAPAVEKRPLIASLIVSSTTLAEDRIKVKTPGNLLYVNYHKLAAGKK